MRKKILALSVLILAAACIIYAAAIPSLPRKGPDLEQFFETMKDPDIELLLSDMTLEEKVGQMFMGCFYNGTPSPDLISEYYLGSLLLFGESFSETTPEALKKQLEGIEAASEIPPVVAVDEEGGSVTRISSSKSFRKERFESPRRLYEKGGLDTVIADTHEKNALLSSLGIHMNLAPVCDISQDPDNFMYSRSLGRDAETTAGYIAAVTEACLEDGTACVLKHFPGYGSSADTHKGLAIDKRSLSTITDNDLLPFEAGIRAGAPAVLISHNIVTAIDDRLPSSLSPACHRLLMQKLRFDGVIITDDLSMGAISNYLPAEKSAVAAVAAGNDILCTGSYKKQYKAVLDAVSSGIITEDRIDRSVRKILKLKIDLGLIDPAEE